ncbi:L-type lectin-domain containing receptor kinase IX.1 [Senna tora]|uniref:L-type lectin-domain containing receptor kinase IX.1 n=1 Tax=Senna tora TaxID=362788 RepID=A0A835CH88_9FABA|nr:L-type lectin-domain containing receptor kinase IX.1 [Senna tora]
MMMLVQFLFLLLIPHTFSLSFTFPNFNPKLNNNITYEGSAFPTTSSIQLATNQSGLPMTWTAGRATYNRPMHLWNRTAGSLSDFTTHFSFGIRAGNTTEEAGDGMAFFLAPSDSKFSNDSTGGALGLTPYSMTLNSKQNPFVAVEFDIFSNEWDPPQQHVGVDINSVISVANLTWMADIKGNRSYEAKISYNSSTQNLSILFTGFHNDTKVLQHIYYVVDLRDYLPEWVTFGFSASTAIASAIYDIKSWNFTSTLKIISPSPSPNQSPSLSPSFKSKNSMIGLGVGLGVGGFVLICGMCLVLFGLWKRRKNMKEMEEDDHLFDEYMSEEFERGAGPKKFSYVELASATNYFKDENKLGHGGFGDVYRGFLKDSSSYVAIKKVSDCSRQGVKEFASEVRIISQLRHRNLVQLIGWCHERKELLLVYEYMPNGSLDSHLFRDRTLMLSWTVRFKIAQGLASALLYLHEEWEQCVLHRDIKSSNIMLDSNFNARLGDFGLARLVDHTKSGQTTALAGTMGYMAPEYLITSRASKESDVYSFGVVLLEIACGRKPIKHTVDEEYEINIVEWVWGLNGSGRILEAVDPRLCGDFDQKEIECLMIVGLWCASPNHNKRPSIKQAIQVLNFEAPLPNLPSSFPIPIYLEVPTISQNMNVSSSSNTNSSVFTTTSDLVPPSVSLSLSFTFPNFNPKLNNITYEGSALATTSSIQLATNISGLQMAWTAGRATYNRPMHLWNRTAGSLSDFTTHFSFGIRPGSTLEAADGMAFFLAPSDSKFPNDSSGSALGLTSRSMTLNSKQNPFVAVEFDIYSNEWDPPQEHVGVDINSVISVANLIWMADINGNRSYEAKISYNSTTQNLSIFFTGFHNDTMMLQHIYYVVDLRDYLPEWVTFGFSASTAIASAIYDIKSWNFTSTLKTISPSPSPRSSPSFRSKTFMTGLGVGLGVGGFVLICGMCLVLFGLWKRRKNMKEIEEDDHLFDEHMSEEFERGAGPKKFSYVELASATNYFKDENKLGLGGFGYVYKGFLKDSSSYVAIKKLSECSRQGTREFASEVRIISQLRHRNLVQLIGWCYERKELLLVYEYMPNGSLDSHLFRSQTLMLSWTVRFKIAQGLASALLYLHEEWEQCVLHRDIKSSNIMLDSNFNARLGDFGLARLVDHTKGGQTTALAGTMGYMAPEYLITCRASKESDVYSFGVVLLEIACGRKPIKHTVDEEYEINIVEWVWGLNGSGRILEAVDPRLCGDFDQKEIECLMMVGLWCASPNHNKRPSIKQAIQVLNFEAPLPDLPATFPIPIYLEVPTISQNMNVSSSSNTNSSVFTTTSDHVPPSVPRLN